MRHPVPCDFITKEKIKEFLNKRVKDVAKPEDLRAEELTLKKFGLVPADFDLAKNTIELLTEQAAAFYDYDRKKLFITDTTSSETQEPVLAHEIAHAIADQNYNLAKFIKAGRKSDDGATARLAVMEGQATWLMSELLARKMGQSLKDSPALLAMMSGANDGGAGQFPVFDNSPLYLRLTLVFPYTKGMLFQNAVFDRDGQNGIRRGLPQASRFHPADSAPGEILQRRQTHASRRCRSPTFPRATRAWWADRSANWSTPIMLEQYSGKARAAEIAPHWRGCAFDLLENKKAGRMVLLYAAEWDTEDAARQYFAAYRRQLSPRSGKRWRSPPKPTTPSPAPATMAASSCAAKAP